MRVKLTSVQTSTATTLVCSLPLPPFPVQVTVPGADSVQTVPLGEWPARALVNPRVTWPWPKGAVKPPKPFANPPRRCLLYAHFPQPAPRDVSVNLTPTAKAATAPTAATDHFTPVACELRVVLGAETYHKRDEVTYHYVKREDSVLIQAGGRELTLRLAFRVNGELRYWQFAQVTPVWSGSLCAAYVAGGHIYGGAVDRPMTALEGKTGDQQPFYKEDTISAKAFVVVHAGGLVEMTTHFANVQAYGNGTPVAGLPVVELSAPEPLFPEPVRIAVAEGTTEVADGGGTWRWTPLSDTRIFLGVRHAQAGDGNVTDFAAGSENGFVNGVGRSFSCSLDLTGQGRVPARYLAEPEWYLTCAEFGLALPAPDSTTFPALQAISDEGVPVFLRNLHPDGMARGGVYRYLDGERGRYELSMDGNEASFLMRGAYLRTHGDLYRAALEAARCIADVCVDHWYFNVHYHGDVPAWNTFSLIYLRFGGLVHGWLETGDPWYLENAEAVANRWIMINRQNQPRQNMGRDAEPVEGILLLYDFTGKDHYFQEAEKIAHDVANTLDPEFCWRSGCGVGPFWGVNALRGTPWNGSHLLAGLAEFLTRATPESCARYDGLLAKAVGMTHRLYELIRTDCAGFHRASGSFIPRRHFLMAYLAQDERLLAETADIVRGIEAKFQEQGPAFYTTGHHCGGYLDSPCVLRALFGHPPPWR